jgi:hypothetical protein
MKEEMRSGQAEMKSIVSAIEEKMEAWIADMKACQEVMEANPEKREPEAEHRKVPKEDAIVKPAEGQRQRYRDRNLATELCHKLKERTWGNCGPQKRLTIAGRRLTHCAGVAWLQRNIVRKDWTRKLVERGTPKRWMFGKKYRPKPESIREIRIQGLKKQLYVRSERTYGRIFGKTFKLENMKRTAVFLSRFEKSRI